MRVCTGDSVQYINDSVVKPADILVIDRVSVENETTAFTKLRVGVYSVGVFYPLEEQTSPAADTLYWTADEITICEGENLRVELTGCILGDVVSVWISGYKNQRDRSGE